MKKANWRLRKTLGRPAAYRVIEDDDIRYIWAAARKGALEAMGPRFAAVSGMSLEDFKALFERTVLEDYHGVWTVLAPTRRGVQPVGLVFGIWASKRQYMDVVGIAWFPWATKRNTIEATVAFFNSIRKEIPMVGYATDEHKRLYEVCCMHGVMRRVGTSFLVFPGSPAAVFETRA